VIRTRGGYWLSQAGIICAAGVLIALAWGGALSAIRVDREAAEARAGQSVSMEALAFEQQVQRQLLAFDQTLRILRQQWEQDPDHFDLASGRAQAVLLNEVSGSLLMTDEHGRVVQSSVPGGVGLDLSGGAMFRTLLAQPADADTLYIGPAGQGQIDRDWHMNLALRLHHRDGTFAGVLAATYKTDALSRFFTEAHLSPDDLIAVVGIRGGRVRAEVGRVPVSPDTSLRGSAMFKAMEEMPDGIWIGRSAPDGISRIHAFRRIPNRDLEVAVGVDRDAALVATGTWAAGAWLFASGTTALVGLMAGVLLRETRSAHWQAEVAAQEHARLAAHNAELAAARARADAKAAQLEATLAGMTDGVAMVDAGHRLMEWNSLFPQISGVPAALLGVGVSMEQMVRAQAELGEFGQVDVEAEVTRRMALLRSGRVTETTERARPNGQIIELRRNFLPDGGMVTLYTDITARKQVENALRMARSAAEETAAAKARFTAIVSHEIRTPLNALLSSLQLLAEGQLSPAQQAQLDLARQSGDTLLSLVNDILDLSRLEAGQLTLRRSVFALQPLLNGTLEMLRILAGRRGISLRLALADDAPHLMYADPVRLRQILVNLLGNAAKYAAPGEVVLDGTIRRRDGKLTLRLAVRDQGPVIPEAERVRLFQPFAQLNQPEGDLQPGSGLGLSICRMLATLMDGAIGCHATTFRAASGRDRIGNEFWLELPIVPLPPDAAAPAARTGGALVLPRTRILLAEDVVASRVVVSRMLRRAGHMVDAVGTAQDAIAAVSSRPYDVVLMDVHMPGMSGIDAARHIRILPGVSGVVPIIALTATLIGEDTVLCRAAGMNGILTKPASLAELLDTIARHAWPGCVPGARQPAPEPPIPAVEIADVPVLAERRLSELRQHLPATTLCNLVEDCLLDLQTRLPTLRAALADGDVARIVAAAHAMHGVAAGYGMSALDRRLQGVVAVARAQGPEATVALAETLDGELARAAVALREFLGIETAYTKVG
jgi:signal transduction histidine kinase/DNA-binding LytR/AlgR family response regulator